MAKSLLEGTLEAIMWSKWGSPSIPLGRGDLHITHPELCESDSWLDSKVDSACVRVSELFRTEFLDTTINNCQTG